MAARESDMDYSQPLITIGDATRLCPVAKGLHGSRCVRVRRSLCVNVANARNPFATFLQPFRTYR